MPTYDAIVVLGSQPRDPANWEFPSHVYKSLDSAAEQLRQGVAPFVVVSGKWAIRFDALEITQPFLECDKMAEYLLKIGVPADCILREDVSKDTISNLYYLKKLIFQPRSIKNLLFIAAEFRLRRIQLICEKVLGPDYVVDYEGVDFLPEERYPNEERTFMVHSEFLAPMTPGDDAWLDDKFYDAPMYTFWKELLLTLPPSERFFS